jgi:predicted glycoside hydrolase/deacetylase ChbG (UPF0249 family)
MWEPTQITLDLLYLGQSLVTRRLLSFLFRLLLNNHDFFLIKILPLRQQKDYNTELQRPLQCAKLHDYSKNYMSKEREKPIIIIADDAGSHPAIDRGICITGVDFQIEQEGAVQAALALKRDFPHISVGLHVEIPGFDDFSSTALTYFCRWKPNRRFQGLVTQSTEKQLTMFQDELGHQPAHLSAHRYINLDYRGNPFPWFVNLMENLTEGNLSTILVRGINTATIRLARGQELLLKRKPLTVGQFKKKLEGIAVEPYKPLELFIHPATKANADPPFRAIYGLGMREIALNALMAVVKGGAIEEAGYKLISPEEAITFSLRNNL